MLEDDLKGLPYFIAVPKPDQSPGDDECPHVNITRATVQDMTIFLVNDPDSVPPKCRQTLRRMVNYARLKGMPTDNFWLANGVKLEQFAEFEQGSRESFLNQG